MLIITEILPHAKACMDQFSWWQPLPLHLPYYIFSKDNCDRKSFCCKEFSGSTYKFEASDKYVREHWLWCAAISFSGAVSAFYQILLEDTSTIEIGVHLLDVCGFTLSVMFAYFLHCESTKFCRILNEILRFEERRVDSNSKSERKYWKNLEYRNIIVVGLRTLQITPAIFVIIFSTNVAIFPEAAWRMVSRKLLNQISCKNICDWSSRIWTEVAKRLLSFVYSYIAYSINLRPYILIAVVSIFSAQGSVLYMILAFKRFLTMNHTTQLVSSSRKVENIVSMFREIQVCCGLYNGAHQMRIIPPLIPVCTCCTSMSLFEIVSAWDNMDLQIIFICGGSLIFSCSIVSLGFHFGATLYVKCRKLLLSHVYINSTSLVGTKNKLLMRRYWRSFPFLKIFFLRGNFFEGSTPLVLLDFSISCAINLILLE